MYPLSAEELYLVELVEHWRRSIPEHPPEEELYTALLQAHWKGELQFRKIVWGGRNRINTLTDLHEYFRNFSMDDNPGILFYEHEDELSGNTIVLPDGSTEWCIRACIQLPLDRSCWTPGMVAESFEELEHLKYEHYPRPAKKTCGFAMVERDAFGRLCDRRGWPRPGFWFSESRSAETRRSLVSAQSRTRKWLRDQTRSTKRMSKEGYWAEAQGAVDGLSRRAFEEIWAEVVPPSWRQAGAPKRSIRRGD